MLWYWIYTHAFGDKYTKHFLIILGPPPEILTLSIYIAEFSMFFEMISATDATHVLLFVNLCYFLAFFRYYVLQGIIFLLYFAASELLKGRKYGH